MIFDLSSESLGDNCEMNFLQQLMMARWDSDRGPIQTNHCLFLDRLEASDYLMNAREFLSALMHDNGTPATAAGNLNRAFVWRMFERFRLGEIFRHDVQTVFKALNEYDLYELHLLRVICEKAGLLKKRQGHFQLTPKGREMTKDYYAGELFRTLFITYFRGYPWREHGCYCDSSLHLTAGIVLWRLSQVARDWIPVRGLAEQLIVPSILDEIRGERGLDLIREESLISVCFLDPLAGFALIDRKPSEITPDNFDRDRMIRLTPLWDWFIRFVYVENAQLPEDDS